MKWLIITDNDTLPEQIKNLLLEKNKKNKIISCDFNLETIAKNKSHLDELMACIIYAQDETSVPAALGAVLSSLLGFLAAEKVQILTNIKLLNKDPLFAKDIAIGCETAQELLSILSKKYKKISDNACKCISKKKLLERGIPYTPDCFGTYIAKNKIEIVNEFLSAGMSVNSRDDAGTPMLNIACRNDNYEFVEMIFNLGAELNAVSEDRGYTAVMDAVWRGNEKITRYLISKGADLNTINKEGQNNLILAVGANRESLVKLLVENGADPDVKDMMGMSAYTYAVLFKKQRLVEILQPYHKEI